MKAKVWAECEARTGYTRIAYKIVIGKFIAK
jgi:hypothetical protein